MVSSEWRISIGEYEIVNDSQWTVRSLLRNTAVQFEERGIESPRLTAELLLAQILQMKRVELYLDFDREILEEERNCFQRSIERRLRGEPTNYILGEMEFMGFTLKIQKGVFIPRPETETLCEAVLNQIESVGVWDGLHQNDPNGRSSPTELIVFEIGCGCGAISLALALQFTTNHKYPITNYRIFASDISEEALQNARENARRLGVSSNIQFLKGDLFEPFHPLQLKADLLISNPPYVPSSLLDQLSLEIRKFEPREALDGGEDGLTFLRKIVREAPPLLKKGGLLALEVGEGQASTVQDLINPKDGFQEVEIFKDLAGIRRGVLAKLSVKESLQN